jgi:hypothetical protein
VNARNEAAAKEIAKIRNNTLDALAKLVNLTFIWVFKNIMIFKVSRIRNGFKKNSKMDLGLFNKMLFQIFVQGFIKLSIYDIFLGM